MIVVRHVVGSVAGCEPGVGVRPQRLGDVGHRHVGVERDLRDVNRVWRGFNDCEWKDPGGKLRVKGD